jgi:hypothetical protein
VKRALGVVGSVAGVGVPAWSFFSSYPPPLFPGVTLITAALSGAIWAMTRKKSDGAPGAAWRIIIAMVLLTTYIALLQFATLPIPPEKDKRVQIGFGMADSSLTDTAKRWKQTHPEITAYDMADKEAAFEPDRVPLLWQTWSIYTAGSCLIALYLIGFSLWTAGFALLGIRDNAAPAPTP